MPVTLQVDRADSPTNAFVVLREDDVWAERKLARAVIAHAAAEADARPGTTVGGGLITYSVREEARAFLRGGEGLAAWCAAAGINEGLIARVARKRWPDGKSFALNGIC